MKNLSATRMRDNRWHGLFPAAILAAVLFHAASVAAQPPQTLAELEAACEQQGFGEEQCLSTRGCCNWDDDQCWAGDLEACNSEIGFPITTIDEEGDANADEGQASPQLNEGDEDENDEADKAEYDMDEANDAEAGEGMMTLQELERLCEDPSISMSACRRMPCCFYENERCWAGEPGTDCTEAAGQEGVDERDEDNDGDEHNGNEDNNDDGGVDDSNNNTPPAGSSCLDEYSKRLGIEPVPDTAPAEYRSSYCQYTYLEAPSGRRVEIFGQSQISSLQMYRARALLSFYLEDVPGSQWGSNKKDVLEIMAANRAKLDIPNGAHEAPGAGKSIDGQELYWAELPVEGDVWYMKNDWEHRDAAFEEILHLVHDTGIGVIEGMGVLPEFQEEILKATVHSGPKLRGGTGTWANNSPDWIEELAAENSLTQEYLASVIDAYYGLWEAWTEGSGSMWGIYYPKGRNDIASLDPPAWELIPKFFNPYLTYMAYLSPTLEGTFKMSLDPDLPYTFKSQYLLHATLLGEKNVDLFGNDQDNRLGPNSGFNMLDGGEGEDTAVFQGRCAEYVTGIAGDGDGDVPPMVRLADQVSGRDGATMLMNIEVIEFSDSRISFPFDSNDGGSLLCPESPSPAGAEDIPGKALEDSGADAPGMKEEIPADGDVSAVGSGLKDEGEHTNTTEYPPDEEIKEEGEGGTGKDGDVGPPAGEGTDWEKDLDPDGALDELQPDAEDAEATTDGGENQEYEFEGPDEDPADTIDLGGVDLEDIIANYSAGNATDAVPASPITIQASEEQDMIVEAVGFLLNLPNLQVEDLESEAIMNDLKEALASGAGVTKDLVHILRVYAGSVVVDSQIVFPEAHRDAAVSFREALETNTITEVFKEGAPTLGLTAATVSQVSSKTYIDYREFKAANNINRADDGIDYDESSARREQRCSQSLSVAVAIVTMAAVLDTASSASYRT